MGNAMTQLARPASRTALVSNFHGFRCKTIDK
jgi:hypothetical protein